MSIRAEKAASVIKREIAGIITRFAQEHSAGLATVTAVRLSNDLQNAKIYISLYGGKTLPGQFIHVLELKSGEIRHSLGRNVKLRYIPELKFFHDDSLDQIEHIQKLLDSVKKEQSENN